MSKCKVHQTLVIAFWTESETSSGSTWTESGRSDDIPWEAVLLGKLEDGSNKATCVRRTSPKHRVVQTLVRTSSDQSVTPAEQAKRISRRYNDTSRHLPFVEAGNWKLTGRRGKTSIPEVWRHLSTPTLRGSWKLEVGRKTWRIPRKVSECEVALTLVEAFRILQ